MYWKKKKTPKSQKTLLSEGISKKDVLIIAEKMISQGSPLERIMEITGLSNEEILDIRKM